MTGTRFVCGILDRIDDPDEESALLKDVSDIRCYRARGVADLPEDIADLDAVTVWHELDVTAEILARLERCRVVVRAGAGYDSVDLAVAGRLGIPVVNVPDYGVNDVADHTVMLLLSALRRLSRYEKALRADPVAGWAAEIGGHGMRRLRTLSVGIVGFGRIGSAVAHRLRAFGCDVGFHDPYLPAGVERSWQLRRYADLSDLLSASDIVMVHVPQTPETYRMIDSRALAALPAGAILVNTSRGGVVELDAVYEALREGRLGGFAADVLSAEPPDPAHPLLAAYTAQEEWQLGRIVLTPHSAFYSDECERELRQRSAQAMRDALEGRPLENCVNLNDLQAPRAAVRSTGTSRP